MATVRIALANLRFPATPEESVALAEQAIAQASLERAQIICFPECYVPGYRARGKPVPLAGHAVLARAGSAFAPAAKKANVALFLAPNASSIAPCSRVRWSSMQTEPLPVFKIKSNSILLSKVRMRLAPAGGFSKSIL